MIQSIYIINSAGETEASIEVGDFDVDEGLIGGFLSAIQMFTTKMAGELIEEMITTNHRMIVSRVGSYLVVTIHGKDDKDTVERNKRVVSVFQDNISHGITEELLKLLRESVKED